MQTEKAIKRDNKYVLHTYARSQVVLAEGHGMTAADPEGKRYLDFTSGIGVNALGYCDEGWVKAVTEQAGKIQHMSNYYYCDKKHFSIAISGKHIRCTYRYYSHFKWFYNKHPKYLLKI